jgi:hypothetical protein
MGGCGNSRLLLPVCNPPPGQIVRGELHSYAIAGENPDVEFAHFPGDVSKNDVSVVEFDPEHGVGQRFDDRTLDFNCFFFGQRNLLEGVIICCMQTNCRYLT